MSSTLFFVVPCFNEEDIIFRSAVQLLEKLKELKAKDVVSTDSRVFFVDDGSRDSTWEIITRLHERGDAVSGISLSKNYGHQLALYAGLMEACGKCDFAVTLDADGQHDLAVVEDMIKRYEEGNDVVCAVRKGREPDSIPKSFAAGAYYSLLRALGVNIIKNHSDYRLVSSDAVMMLRDLRKKALFLRTDFLKLPVKVSTVEYKCGARLAGRSKYSAGKMMKLAADGLINNGLLPKFGEGDVTGYDIKARI